MEFVYLLVILHLPLSSIPRALWPCLESQKTDITLWMTSSKISYFQIGRLSVGDTVRRLGG